MPDDRSLRASRWLRGCLIAASLVTCLHFAALPLVIPYDGHEYIDFADVLLSSRFPRDWQPPIRTPGYPLLLKAAFGLVGRQPLAVVAVNIALAWGLLLLIAHGVRVIAGGTAAGWAVVAVACFPLSVAYQHHVLTEIGVATLLAAATAVLIMPAGTARAGWLKALALAATLTSGYFLRQSLQFVFPVAALLFPLSLVHRPSDPWRVVFGRLPSGGWRIAAQTAVVAILPVAVSFLWEPYLDSRGIRDYMLKQGVLRQALLPVGDPLVEPASDAYAAAVAQAWQADRLVSGIEATEVGRLAGPLYPRLDPAGPTYLRLATHHPTRFAAGFGRTLLLFVGWPAAQSTNKSAEHAAFGPTLGQAGNRIDPGPPMLDASTRAAFEQTTAMSPVAAVLWWLAPVYDRGFVPAGFLTLVGFGLAGLVARDLRLVSVAALPLAYLLAHAALLASEDRYAFPAQPLFLASLAAGGSWSTAWLVRRRP